MLLYLYSYLYLLYIINNKNIINHHEEEFFLILVWIEKLQHHPHDFFTISIYFILLIRLFSSSDLKIFAVQMLLTDHLIVLIPIILVSYYLEEIYMIFHRLVLIILLFVLMNLDKILFIIFFYQIYLLKYSF